MSTKNSRRAKQPELRQVREITLRQKLGRKVPIGMYWALKSQTKLKDLFAAFRKTISDSDSLAQLHGRGFPATIEELSDNIRLSQESELLSEVMWAIASSILNGERIASFCSLREQYEASIAESGASRSNQLLRQIEERFGQSVWLAQNAISWAYLWEGVEGARAMSARYEERIPVDSLLIRIVRLLFKRTQYAGNINEIAKDILSISVDGRVEAVHAYLRHKIIRVGRQHKNELTVALCVDSTLSAIDYYETLVGALQAIALDKQYQKVLEEAFAHPMRMLYAQTRDSRLIPVLVAAGQVVEIEPKESDIKRSEIVALFAAGDYQSVKDTSEAYLYDYPTDIVIVSKYVRACSILNTRPGEMVGALRGVPARLSEVFAFSPSTYSEALSIISLCTRFSGHVWSECLLAIVLHSLREETLSYPSPTLKKIAISDNRLTPAVVMVAPKDARKAVLDVPDVRSLYPATISAIKVSLGIDEGHECNLVAESRNRAMARWAIEQRDYISALERLHTISCSPNLATRMRALILSSLCHLRLGSTGLAISLLLDAYYKNPHVPTVLPLQLFAAEIDRLGKWPSTIDTPLFLELFTSLKGDERLPQLRIAFEDFQLYNNVTGPNDISEKTIELGSDRVAHYLGRVWRPEVMRQTLLYENANEIEKARIEVCRVAIEVDPANASEYADEIKERAKKLEIAAGANLFEQSKVHVDVAAIKKILRNRLRGKYPQYKTSQRQGVEEKTDVLIKSISAVFEQGGGRDTYDSGDVLSRKLSEMLSALSPAERESQTLFASIVNEVAVEFLNGAYGLNAYLSTRVRHGKLNNVLRKVVQDEHLVTARERTTNKYVPNTYWIKAYDQIPEELRDRLQYALNRFSEKFDQIVSKIRDQLIQIKLVDRHVAVEDRPLAIFTYEVTGQDFRELRKEDQSLASLDELVDKCIERLWLRTDENLAKLRAVLNTELRDGFRQIFDELARDVMAVDDSGSLSGIQNAINRARTNLQHRLGQVIEWFKRGQVYDRPDYVIDLPVQVARSILQKTISGASGWSILDMQIRNGSDVLPGRTLDGLVDVFCDIFSNAISHSGLEPSELKVKVVVGFIKGVFSARVTNNLAAGKPTEADGKKLDHVRSALGASEVSSRALSEGGSGIHKIWRTVNSPFYSQATLDFFFEDSGSFTISMSMNLGGVGDEDTVD